MRFNLSRALSIALFILVILCVLFVGWAFLRYVGKGGGLGFLLGGLENNVDLPNAVMNFNATPGDGFITLNWKEPVSGVKPTEYHIYRGGNEASQDYLAKTENITFTDASVINGVEYFYAVTAANKSGEGPFSEKIKATPTKSEKPIVPPPTPAQRVPYGINDMAAVSAANFVSLAWSAPYNGGSSITRYRIYRSVAPGAYLDANFIREIDAPTPPATSYIDYLVTSGITYYYRVSAANSIGEGPRAKEVSVTVGQQYSLPPQVTGLIITPSYTSVSLSWTAPFATGTPITSYRIYRSTVPGANSFLGSTNNNYYTDGGLASGAVYYYRVSAVSGVSEGPRSMEVPVRTTDYYYPPVYPPVYPPINYTYPGQPQLYASAGDSVAYLSWYAPSGGGTAITYYRIYQGNYYGGEYLVTNVPAISGNSYTVTGLNNNQTYYFRISAVNGAGEGTKSSSMSVTPHTSYCYDCNNFTVPSAPILSVDNVGESTINLSWSESYNGGTSITSYKIYRSVNYGTESQLTTVYSSPRSYRDSYLSAGTYSYRIKAVNGIGESYFSNQVTGILPETISLSAPSLSLSTTNSYIQLSWNNISGATGYRIYRRTGLSNSNKIAETNSLSYRDVSVSRGITYYYKVLALNSTTESPFSDERAGYLAQEVYCAQDVKRCSDGSYVGRIGPNCEFESCPDNPPVTQSYVEFVSVVPNPWNRNSSVTLSWKASADFVTCRLYFPEYLVNNSPVTVVSPNGSKTFGPNSNISLGQKSLGLRCFNQNEEDHVYDYRHLDYWNVSGTYLPTRPNYEQWGMTASATVNVVN